MPVTQAETPEDMKTEVDAEREDPLDFDDPAVELPHNTQDSDDDTVVDDEEDEEVTFPADLIERAEASGLTREEALESESPAKLIKLLDKHDDQIAALDKKAGDDADEFEIDLDEDIFSPEVAKAIKGVNTHFGKKIASLKAEMKRLSSHIEAQKQGERVRRFDGYIDDLGKDHEKILGKGPSDSLDSSSQESRNRKAIAAEMTTMRLGYMSQNKQAPGEPDLFKRALRAVLGDELDSLSQGRVKKKFKKRQNQMISSPTHSRAEPVLSATQTAINSVAQKLKELGIDEYGSDEEDLF